MLEQTNDGQKIVHIDPERNKYEAAELLRGRFYFLKTVGGQHQYYDAETGLSQLNKSHLWGQLGRQGFDLKEAQEITKFTRFSPIVPQPLYRPKGPQVVDVKGYYHPNSWANDGVKPSNDDPTMFVEHLERMLGSKAKAGYLIRMLAYRYQTHEIAKKPHVAFYFYGKPGMGKSLLSTTIQTVFGRSAVSKATDEKALDSKSSVDLWKRTWLIVEEVDIRRGSTNYNTIKTMTGSCLFDAERKNEHFRQHETPAQLIMLSNDAPSFLEDGDRRFFVSKYECEFKDKKDKDDYFNRYIDWLENGGYAAIAGLLLVTDISGVDLASAAPITVEKEEALKLSVDPAVDDIVNLLEEHEDKKAFVLENFEEIRGRHKMSPRVLIHRLMDAGMEQGRAVKILIKGGSQGKEIRKQVRPWTRKGDWVDVPPGKKAVVRFKDGEETKEIALDEALRGLVGLSLRGP